MLLSNPEGIGVGMISSIPTHNLCELVDTEVALIRNPDLTVEELMETFKGPDFATGGFCDAKGLLDVYSTGVIIVGESGIGKSETAMELIKKGHILVSDDRVDISLVRNKLIGRSPELLRNMIEVRGIGIIDVQRMFRRTSLRTPCDRSYRTS